MSQCRKVPEQPLNPSSEIASNAPATAMPAWLLSTVVHLFVLIALVLLVGRVPAERSEEPARSVSIALIERHSDNSTEYLSAGEAEPIAPATTSHTPAVPNAAPPVIPEIKLPAPRDLKIGQANSDQLVVIPKLNSRDRRPILPGLNDEAILAEEAARRKGTVDQGSPGILSLFGGDKIAGHSFIFVIDRSKSMGAEGLGALSAASNELQRELRQLEPRHKFQIIAYNHTPLYMSERNLLDATPENVGRVQNYFASLAAYGATAHETALLSALRRNPDAIILLTDGGDPFLNDSQLARIQSRAGDVTSIHCIQFGFGALEEEGNFMQKLARQNRGGYRYVDMARWPPRE